MSKPGKREVDFIKTFVITDERRRRKREREKEEGERRKREREREGAEK